METSFKKPLSGIIPPLVTPLKNNETLDVESLERLIEHLIEGGVHGLFVLGTTGEEQSLSYDVRKQMIKESSRASSKNCGKVMMWSERSAKNAKILFSAVRLPKRSTGWSANSATAGP